jgi:hypothetical protein
MVTTDGAIDQHHSALIAILELIGVADTATFTIAAIGSILYRGAANCIIVIDSAVHHRKIAITTIKNAAPMAAAAAIISAGTTSGSVVMNGAVDDGEMASIRDAAAIASAATGTLVNGVAGLTALNPIVANDAVPQSDGGSRPDKNPAAISFTSRTLVRRSILAKHKAARNGQTRNGDSPVNDRENAISRRR